MRDYLRGELWLHSRPSFGNAQVQLVLAARQVIDIQTETQRIIKLCKIAVANANLCGKIRDVRTLLKYAEMW